ncbi:hypothetical protein DFS33DRAFT_1482070 [Desarmillaria ectypa]|nr:hypothetical protein DFS33DRAFT_1482070 [Desarmillaria ectypa]
MVRVLDFVSVEDDTSGINRLLPHLEILLSFMQPTQLAPAPQIFASSLATLYLISLIVGARRPSQGHAKSPPAYHDKGKKGDLDCRLTAFAAAGSIEALELHDYDFIQSFCEAGEKLKLIESLDSLKNFKVPYSALDCAPASPLLSSPGEFGFYGYRVSFRKSYLPAVTL